MQNLIPTNAVGGKSEVVHLKAAETSRQVKKHLVKLFGIKFSVTMKHCSLRIRWTDGPSIKEVEQAVKIFEGAEMVQNGGDMIKGYKEYVDYQGMKIDFGIDFIFCEREYSETFASAVEVYLFKRYGEMDHVQRNHFEGKVLREMSESALLEAASIE